MWYCVFYKSIIFKLNQFIKLQILLSSKSTILLSCSMDFDGMFERQFGGQRFCEEQIVL